ncbi:hypothetical protein ZIOFF_048659 [Zingiber officinale]|uniref:Uncharacterized protein n=1 Tax=Zingiber officinale TaxID=94328 RepID=A0A8J5KMW2_ZINOF|nr:hypothetical protein ZIOFF_048659 [Zingiber officinale]
MRRHLIRFGNCHPGYFCYCKVSTQYALLPPPPQLVLLPHRQSLVPDAVKDPAVGSDSAPLIDVIRFEYPPNRTVIVKTKLVSKIAEKKT